MEYITLKAADFVHTEQKVSFTSPTVAIYFCSLNTVPEHTCTVHTYKTFQKVSYSESDL